jgi:hypothetical protein
LASTGSTGEPDLSVLRVQDRRGDDVIDERRHGDALALLFSGSEADLRQRPVHEVPQVGEAAAEHAPVLPPMARVPRFSVWNARRAVLRRSRSS